MKEQWVVTYRCACGRVLNMDSARPGDMVLIGRAWCVRCQRYVTKSEASAESSLVAVGSTR